MFLICIPVVWDSEKISIMRHCYAEKNVSDEQMAAKVLSGFALMMNTCLIYIQAKSGRRLEKKRVWNPAVIVVLKLQIFCTPYYYTLILPSSLPLDSLPLLCATALTDSTLWRLLEKRTIHIELLLSTMWGFSQYTPIQLDTLMATLNWARLHAH